MNYPLSPRTKENAVECKVINMTPELALHYLSNNPAKRAGLEGYGLSIAERVPLVVAPNEHNARYLATKAARMGHDYEEPDAGRQA